MEEKHCEFCKIVEGDSPAHHILENEHAIAFLDINPAIEGHTLIIPKDHHANLLLVEDGTMSCIFDAIETIGTAMMDQFDADGFSVFHTTGTLIGNKNHAHIHLLPRYEDDNITLSLPRLSIDDEEGEYISETLQDFILDPTPE